MEPARLLCTEAASYWLVTCGFKKFVNDLFMPLDLLMVVLRRHRVNNVSDKPSSFGYLIVIGNFTKNLGLLSTMVKIC